MKPRTDTSEHVCERLGVDHKMSCPYCARVAHGLWNEDLARLAKPWKAVNYFI